MSRTSRSEVRRQIIPKSTENGISNSKNIILVIHYKHEFSTYLSRTDNKYPVIALVRFSSTLGGGSTKFKPFTLRSQSSLNIPIAGGNRGDLVSGLLLTSNEPSLVRLPSSSVKYSSLLLFSVSEIRLGKTQISPEVLAFTFRERLRCPCCVSTLVVL